MRLRSSAQRRSGEHHRLNRTFRCTLRLMACRSDFDVVNLGKVPFWMDQDRGKKDSKENQ